MKLKCEQIGSQVSKLLKNKRNFEQDNCKSDHVYANFFIFLA